MLFANDIEVKAKRRLLSQKDRKRDPSRRPVIGPDPSRGAQHELYEMRGKFYLILLI